MNKDSFRFASSYRAVSLDPDSAGPGANLRSRRGSLVFSHLTTGFIDGDLNIWSNRKNNSKPDMGAISRGPRRNCESAMAKFLSVGVRKVNE